MPESEEPIQKQVIEKLTLFEKLPKIEKHEIKEKPEKFEVKEKPEKVEHKEKPEKTEHKEFKEKDFKEIEKTILDKAFERPQNPGDPVEARLAALEQSVASLHHFITSGQRPNLSRGALNNEPDSKNRT